MSSGAERLDGSSYVIRQYEPRDSDDFLELHDRVFGDGSEEWFAWKFEDNPYVSNVPIFVAETDRRIVGARPFLGFRMQVGDRTRVALQTGDTMVHPDHRRQGLFTRMTQQAFDYYADREPAFTFNVPNAISRPGYLDLGCEVVTELETYYRVQDPAAFADFGGTIGTIARLSKPLARRYLDVKDTIADVPPEVTVSRHVDVPVETFASLYERRLPEAIHAVRDEQFYEYRFGNPQWDYTAYTASLDESPVAGVVTGSRIVDGNTVTNLADVVPLVGGEERDRCLAGIVSRVLEDHDDSDVIAFRGPSLPDSLLSQFGFLSDHDVPLALAATPTVLIACPLPVDGGWQIGNRDLRTDSNWLPTFVEQNTS